jgi:hypothetical protein
VGLGSGGLEFEQTVHGVRSLPRRENGNGWGARLGRACAVAGRRGGCTGSVASARCGTGMLRGSLRQDIHAEPVANEDSICTRAVFRLVVRYMYTSCSHIDQSNAIPVL